MMKVCKLCGGAKPADAFYANHKTRDGKDPRCRQCHNLASVANRERPMTRSRYLRQKVYERDKGVCASCGRYDPKWQADHIVELWEGGKDTIENAQTLCRQHHQNKTSDAAPVRAKADRLRERHDLMKARTAAPR